MRICIDARSPGYAGILNYASCLLRSLGEIDQTNEYIIVSDHEGQWPLPGAEETIVPSNNPLRWTIWSNTQFAKILEAKKVDVYHSLKHITAFRGKSKKTVTFHSARFFLFPEHYKWYDFAYWRMMYPIAAKKYDCVITVSEAERANYAKYIGVPEKKFRVIHLAADTRFHIIENDRKLQETKHTFNLPDRFILFVGRLLPVKNLENIIKAYHLAKKRKKLEHKLVLVGKASWHSKTLQSLVCELGLHHDVVFTGPIFDELPCVYNLADLFVFPSYYEAFPAVPLEAMACGVPVITARAGGLPEVVGDAAILVSPTNVDELADAMIQVLSSNELRASMAQKGLERPRLFSWERCAREHLQVYEDLVQN